VHHLDLYECDPTASYDDNHLPDGLCDEMPDDIKFCSSNFATVWAVGGDVVSERKTPMMIDRSVVLIR
jgi:hypothetical protein